MILLIVLLVLTKLAGIAGLITGIVGSIMHIAGHGFGIPFIWCAIITFIGAVLSTIGLNIDL